MNTNDLINTVAQVLKAESVAPSTLRKVIEALNAKTAAEAAKKEATHDPKKRAKQQFVILVSDPEGKMPKVDLVGWVLQIPEVESSATTVDRIRKAAGNYNNSKKGMLLPVQTIGDTLENVPAKWWKDEDSGERLASVKTKVPVLLVTTNNKLA